MSPENQLNILSTANKNEIKSFAFFDIETTGLPLEENNRTKITEISVVACSTAHLNNTKFGELPRVLHKLTLCVNPFKRISCQAEELTGLSNNLLEHEQKFDKTTVEILTHFLSRLQKPCVLVAHNGLNFDFPVLKRMMDMVEPKLLDGYLVADSLKIFQEIDNIEELLVAETTVRPLSPNINETFQANENNKLANEEKALDAYIKKELEDSGIEHSSQGKTDGTLLNARQLQGINETTPQKQISKYGNIPSIKPSYSTVDKSTPCSSNTVLETLTQNNKRPHKISSKSRRDLFGAKKSFTLTTIYRKCFDQSPQHSHYAESDVITLLKCAIAKKEDFSRVAQEQAVFFKEIKALGK